jgi:hypothetical protein
VICPVSSSWLPGAPLLLVNNSLLHNVTLVQPLHRYFENASFAAYWWFVLHQSYFARLDELGSRLFDTYVHLCPPNSSPSEHHTTAAPVYIIFTDEADVELLAYEADSLCG